MKVRKFVVCVLSVAVLITGFLGYAYGNEAEPGDWHSRGIYTDQLRWIWWPMFVCLSLILIKLLMQMHKKDQDDRSGVMAVN